MTFAKENTPKRRSVLDYQISIVETVASRGTCSRLQVGAIIVRDGRVISSGYNGAPSKMEHCHHPPGDNTPCQISVHAEANAIAFAARYGVSTEGCIMVTTHAPCAECAKLIINAGIIKVVFGRDYRSRDGIKLLDDAGVYFLKAYELSNSVTDATG